MLAARADALIQINVRACLRVRLESQSERPSRRMRSMTEAAQRNAVAEAMVASKSLARRRLRPSQAKKRSTTQRRGCTAKPIWLACLRTISTR